MKQLFTKLSKLRKLGKASSPQRDVSSMHLSMSSPRASLRNKAKFAAGMIGTGLAASAAYFNTDQPELTVEEINQMSTDLLKSCEYQINIHALMKSILEQINVNNPSMFEEQLNKLKAANFEFTDEQFDLLVNIIAGQAKAMILDTMVKHFGEETVKSIPRAAKLLSHPSRYDIEKSIAPFFRYANKPAAGLFHAEQLRLGVEMAKQDVLNSQSTPVTTGNDVTDDLAAFYTSLRKSRENQGYYDDSIVNKYNFTITLAADAPNSGKYFGDFLNHLKNEVLRTGKPVCAAGILQSGHFSSFDIRVQNNNGQIEAELLYFDSLGDNESNLAHNYGINDAQTNYYTIFKNHFPQSTVGFANSIVQFSTYGCPIFSLIHTQQANEADKTLSLLPQYQGGENLLYSYAKEHKDGSELGVYFHPYRLNEKGFNQQMMGHFDLFTPPAFMEVTKTSFNKASQETTGYTIVDEPADFEAIDDATGKMINVKSHPRTNNSMAKLGLNNELALCKEKDPKRHQEFTSPTHMGLFGTGKTPLQIIAENTQPFLVKDEKTGKESIKKRNAIIENTSRQMGIKLAQQLPKASPERITMMLEQPHYGPELHQQMQTATTVSTEAPTVAASPLKLK